MQSLLSKASQADLCTDYFPYIVIRDALDPDLCDQLIREFPALSIVTENRPFKSNQRFSYPALKALADPNISETWRAFIQYHVSQNFLNDIVSLFGDEIRRLHPEFERTFGPLAQLRATIRHQSPLSHGDIALDAQIAINTPVESPSSVRGPHVDLPNKLFAGLFYMRPPGDETPGGDLELYRFKDQPGYFQGQMIDPRFVERIGTVEYQKNVLVLLINSIHSLHGVTPRASTPQPRLFFNILGEMRQDIFPLGQYQGERTADLKNAPT